MSKTIVLKNRINKIDNAVDILNANLISLDKAIESLNENIKLDEVLIKRFNNKLTLDVLFAEKAEEFIANTEHLMRLECMKDMARKEYASKAYADDDVLETIKQFYGLLDWWGSQIGEEAELENKFGYYQVSEKQVKRLKDSCKASLSDSQAKYIDLLNTYRAAAQARRQFEIANEIYSKVGDIYIAHPDDADIILKNVV